MLVGILSISNGVALGYPIPPVVLNLSGFADKCFIGCDPTYPADRKVIEDMGLRNVEIIDSPWMREVDKGREIATQMDYLVAYSHTKGAEWVLVLQADELIHERDYSMLRRFIGATEQSDGPGPYYPDVVGFSMERLYFWGALNKVRQDWNARLIRLFKPGYFSFLAEGTDQAGMYAGQIKPGRVLDLTYNIYHYSRLGSGKEISKRVRNLDSFFWAEKDLVPAQELPEYDFKTRAYDNYSIVEPPPSVEGTVVDYDGSHPLGIEEWFGVVPNK